MTDLLAIGTRVQHKHLGYGRIQAILENPKRYEIKLENGDVGRPEVGRFSEYYKVAQERAQPKQRKPVIPTARGFARMPTVSPPRATSTKPPTARGHEPPSARQAAKPPLPPKTEVERQPKPVRPVRQQPAQTHPSKPSSLKAQASIDENKKRLDKLGWPIKKKRKKK